MRTLVVLAALLLLVLQAQAEPVPEKAEDALEEQQAEEEDQDMAISFEEAEHSGLRIAGRQKVVTTCYCRKSCRRSESRSGTCVKGRKRKPFCCS